MVRRLGLDFNEVLLRILSPRHMPDLPAKASDVAILAETKAYLFRIIDVAVKRSGLPQDEGTFNIDVANASALEEITKAYGSMNEFQGINNRIRSTVYAKGATTGKNLFDNVATLQTKWATLEKLWERRKHTVCLPPAATNSL